MTTAAPVTTVADSDGGSACAGLAAPMLVEASAAVLSGWGHMGPAELGELSNARAAQVQVGQRRTSQQNTRDQGWALPAQLVFAEEKSADSAVSSW